MLKWLLLEVIHIFIIRNGTPEWWSLQVGGRYLLALVGLYLRAVVLNRGGMR